MVKYVENLSNLQPTRRWSTRSLSKKKVKWSKTLTKTNNFDQKLENSQTCMLLALPLYLLNFITNLVWTYIAHVSSNESTPRCRYLKSILKGSSTSLTRVTYNLPSAKVVENPSNLNHRNKSRFYNPKSDSRNHKEFYSPRITSSKF